MEVEVGRVWLDLVGVEVEEIHRFPESCRAVGISGCRSGRHRRGSVLRGRPPALWVTRRSRGKVVGVGVCRIAAQQFTGGLRSNVKLGGEFNLNDDVQFLDMLSKIDSSANSNDNVDDEDGCEVDGDYIVENNNEEGGDKDIVEMDVKYDGPILGRVSSTRDDAYNFYMAYALWKGFGTRTRYHHKRKGEIYQEQFLCNKGGHKSMKDKRRIDACY